MPRLARFVWPEGRLPDLQRPLKVVPGPPELAKAPQDAGKSCQREDYIGVLRAVGGLDTQSAPVLISGAVEITEIVEDDPKVVDCGGYLR